MFHEGQQIGIYKLIRKLGRGGFGEVWLAEKTSEGFRTFTKKVAVKLPHSEQIDFRAIEQEAMLWEQVSGHANVLPIIDADVFDGQVVIVSEYAEGGSLAEKLEKDGKFSVKKAVEMTIGILKGLDFLHHKQIIHRDIKPQNILLQGDTPRLADFGISRAMNTKTFSSNIVGTDAYMSPEALDGKRNVQTDVWSVGVVLYELLKDNLPFPQEHPSERMFAILMKDFEPLSIDIPFKLRDIVNKALAKKPEERYLSASQMCEDLTAFLAQMLHLDHAETKPFIKVDLAETRRIIESGEQIDNTGEKNNPIETVQPIRLKELDDYARTEPAVTQSSLSTEPIKTISNPIINPPPTQVVNFTNTGKTRWQNNLRFVLYGGVPLVLISIMAMGYVMLFSFNSAPSSNSNTAFNSEYPTMNNKVLNGQKIRFGTDLKGYVSSDYKMTVEMQITGIGEVDVMEEVRKNDNLQIEINSQMANVVESVIVNGSILKIRAETILSVEAAKIFNANKLQDFNLTVTMFYNEDAISKTIETRIRKGKIVSSLGEMVVFGDVLERNVAPVKTKPVVNNPTQTPVQRNNDREKVETTPQKKEQTQTKPSFKSIGEKGTTVDGDYKNSEKNKTNPTSSPEKLTKGKIGRKIE